MNDMTGFPREAPVPKVLESSANAECEREGMIMSGVRQAYWSHVPDGRRNDMSPKDWGLPHSFTPNVLFTSQGSADTQRTIDLWQRAMYVYIGADEDRARFEAHVHRRAPINPKAIYGFPQKARWSASSSCDQPGGEAAAAPVAFAQEWLDRAGLCGDGWKRKSCPLTIEQHVPESIIEKLAADAMIPKQLVLPQTLFGWLLTWRVFEPDRTQARKGMYTDIASTTDWGKYSRGELEDWHSIAIDDIRETQQEMSLTTAVRHILMAKKCKIMATHRGVCIRDHGALGVPVLAGAAGDYPSTNAMICKWYALDMGLPTMAEKACGSDAGRAYFSILKMVNDVHDLAVDTLTGDVGNGVRLYGDGKRGTETIVRWLVGLRHVVPRVATKAADGTLSRDDRTFLAGCAGVAYTVWGHRSDLWPVVGLMAHRKLGWGAVNESECTACRAAPQCGACFYQDAQCTHERPGMFSRGDREEAAEIVQAALSLTCVQASMSAESVERAIQQLTDSSPTALGWHASRKRNDPATTIVAALTQGIHGLAAGCTQDELDKLICRARSAWWHVLPGFDRAEELALDIYLYSTAAHPHLTLTFGSHVADIL